jgi:hypothetical protein
MIILFEASTTARRSACARLRCLVCAEHCGFLGFLLRPALDLPRAFLSQPWILCGDRFARGPVPDLGRVVVIISKLMPEVIHDRALIGSLVILPLDSVQTGMTHQVVGAGPGKERGDVALDLAGRVLPRPELLG